MEFEEEKSEAESGVCVLLTTFVYRLPPHTGQSGLAHAQTTPATATTLNRVVGDSTKVLYLMSAFARTQLISEFFFL